MADPRNFPPEVVAALKAGNKIEAIKLLRQRMNVGLAEAKGAVDARQALYQRPSAGDDSPVHMPSTRPGALPRPRPAPAYVKRDGLSPGEVPRTSGSMQAVIVIIAIVLAIFFYAKFG